MGGSGQGGGGALAGEDFGGLALGVEDEDGDFAAQAEEVGVGDAEGEEGGGCGVGGVAAVAEEGHAGLDGLGATGRDGAEGAGGGGADGEVRSRRQGPWGFGLEQSEEEDKGVHVVDWTTGGRRVAGGWGRGVGQRRRDWAMMLRWMSLVPEKRTPPTESRRSRSMPASSE